MKKFKLDSETKISTGFIVPDYYFEGFSEKILSQVPEKRMTVISLFQNRKKLFFAVAAVFIIGLSIPIYNLLAIPSNTLDTTTLENHLSYQTTINQYDLISELEEEDLTKMGNDIHLKDEAIEDHLISNTDLERLLSE